MKTLRSVLLSVLAILVLSCQGVFAAAGDLDPTFGSGGIVISDLSGVDDRATSIAIQPDGKILAAGFSEVSGLYEWALVRYNPDGTLDTTFNGTGKVFTAFPFIENGPYGDKAYGVALQEDGKIVVAGFATNASFYFDIAVARYNTDGTLDTTFNGTGTVTTHNSGFSDFGSGVVIQPDGRIVVGGYGTDGATFDSFELVRYNSDGSLDATFNGSGVVKTDVGGGGLDEGLAVALQDDGKLILTGHTYTQRCCTGDFATARFNSDGSLDTDFNGSGAVITPTASFFTEEASSAVFHGIALQPDAKILVAGTSSTPDSGGPDFTVARYNSDGSLDTSFNGTGLVTTAFGSFGGEARGISVQSDGKIVGAGVSLTAGAIAVVRYLPDGSLDSSFGGAGTVLTPVESSSNAYALALQDDGKIVVGGSTYDSTHNRTSFVLARYIAESEPPPPLTLAAAVSRRTHGAAGNFDLNLPLTGEPAIECRGVDGNYSLVFTFNNDVITGSAIVTAGTATISGDPIFADNTITVNLAAVADVQTLTITLTGVTDVFDQVLPDTSVTMNVLVGDATADRKVNAKDFNQVKAKVGQPVDSTNYRDDIDASGIIDRQDGKAVKLRRGHSLPQVIVTTITMRMPSLTPPSFAATSVIK